MENQQRKQNFLKDVENFFNTAIGHPVSDITLRMEAYCLSGAKGKSAPYHVSTAISYLCFRCSKDLFARTAPAEK